MVCDFDLLPMEGYLQFSFKDKISFFLECVWLYIQTLNVQYLYQS